MGRRSVVVTLLAVIVLQFVGGMVFASTCLEPCPDDGDGTSCPPICSLCTSCTHAQQAVEQPAVDAFPVVTAPHLFSRHPAPIPSQLAADIFHVPLHG